MVTFTSVLRRVVRRPTHATVVAYLALFMAMSGTAYAAAKWTGADIVDDSLTSADVATDSLTGDDIAPGSIRSGDLDEGALPPAGSGEGTLVGYRTTEPIYWYLGYVDHETGEPISEPAPAGEVFASIPGVADLFVAGCNPSVNDGRIGIRNTSDANLYGFGVTTLPGPDGESSYSEVLRPGEATVTYPNALFIHSDAADAPFTYLQPSLVTMGGDTCAFSAWWTQA